MATKLQKIEDDDESEKGIIGTFEIYRAEGDYLFLNAEYKKAIQSYSTALEFKRGEIAGDRGVLASRARCHLQLGNVDESLKDAEKSLAPDKTYHRGLYIKAEALYAKGEFELALVFYHRGHKLRPELQEFRLGIQKSQEAIDNSVGVSANVKLTKQGDLSYFEEEEDSTSKFRKKSIYCTKNNRKKSSKIGQSCLSVTSENERSIKQLLGELYGDRKYLENLLNETDPTTASGKEIQDLVSSGLRYLDTRTEFWRQQHPLYLRKKNRKNLMKMSKSVTKPTTRFLIKELEKIDEDQTNEKYPASLKRAKKCLKMIENLGDGSIHYREDFVANLHSCIGNAYLEMGLPDKALKNYQLDYQIAMEYALPEAKSRALDNIGRVHARRGDYNRAIDTWMSKIDSSQSPLESTWLFHEIGRCHLELGDLDKAKDLGEKSMCAAVEAADVTWQLNAAVLIAQAEVKQNRNQEAFASFSKALDFARVLGDIGAEACVKKAMEEVNTKIIQAIMAKKEKEAEKERQRARKIRGRFASKAVPMDAIADSSETAMPGAPKSPKKDGSGKNLVSEESINKSMNASPVPLTPLMSAITVDSEMSSKMSGKFSNRALEESGEGLDHKRKRRMSRKVRHSLGVSDDNKSSTDDEKERSPKMTTKSQKDETEIASVISEESIPCATSQPSTSESASQEIDIGDYEEIDYANKNTEHYYDEKESTIGSFLSSEDRVSLKEHSTQFPEEFEDSKTKQEITLVPRDFETVAEQGMAQILEEFSAEDEEVTAKILEECVIRTENEEITANILEECVIRTENEDVTAKILEECVTRTENEEVTANVIQECVTRTENQEVTAKILEECYDEIEQETTQISPEARPALRKSPYSSDDDELDFGESRV